MRKILHGTDPERAADPNALADPDVLSYFGRFRPGRGGQGGTGGRAAPP